MTLVPRYNFLPGTEITLLSRPMAVTGKTEAGYQMVGLDDGAITVVSFDRLVEHLKLPGASINAMQPANGDRARQRMGGHGFVQTLKNKEQQELARFHLAMCKAVDIYVTEQQQNNHRFKPTVRALENSDARRFIAAQTSLLLGQAVRVAAPRGGEKIKGFILYKGRTIYDYYGRYKDLVGGECAPAALAPLIHLRGNRTQRLPYRLRELMTTACEKMALQLTAPSLKNAHDYLEALIHDENKIRRLNDLPPLIVPSTKTLKKHLNGLLTPTEYSIATLGFRETKRRRGRGSTDVRSLMIGELCGMDEQKISMVLSAKVEGFWHKLSEDEKKAYEEIEAYIRKRLHLLVLFDVATRMPLAWIIAENPNAEATLALLRMATRDKTREKLRYGCKNYPAAACGILHLRNDNGSGLRNNTVISALMGVETINTVTRTHSPGERAPDERVFGTIEAKFFKIMPGYTGRRPGEIPGYDAIKNGVVNVEFLYAMLSRYLIDEYPFERHYGVGMFGRRPYDVYQQINETRGQVDVIDPNTRRIHLCWEVSATPTDEGVKVFEGIWFNSEELQLARENLRHTGKVKVFVDPDDLNIATVLMPGHPEPIEVQLQMTIFADMTLGEVLQLVAEYRREEPTVTEIYDDRLMQVRGRRYADISSIGVEHDLPRSYTTSEECKALAKSVFAGARLARTKALADTRAPDLVTSFGSGSGVFPIGEGADVVDATADEIPGETAESAVQEDGPAQSTLDDNRNSVADQGIEPPVKNPSLPKRQSMRDARPQKLKELK